MKKTFKTKVTAAVLATASSFAMQLGSPVKTKADMDAVCGDVNADGVVDVRDLTLLLCAKNSADAVTDEEYQRADLNGGGIVDEDDVERLLNFLKSRTSFVGMKEDIDRNGTVDYDDRDALNEAIKKGDNNPDYDINDDGSVNTKDVDMLCDRLDALALPIITNLNYSNRSLAYGVKYQDVNRDGKLGVDDYYDLLQYLKTHQSDKELDADVDDNGQLNELDLTRLEAFMNSEYIFPRNNNLAGIAPIDCNTNGYEPDAGEGYRMILKALETGVYEEGINYDCDLNGVIDENDLKVMKLIMMQIGSYTEEEIEDTRFDTNHSYQERIHPILDMDDYNSVLYHIQTIQTSDWEDFNYDGKVDREDLDMMREYMEMRGLYDINDDDEYIVPQPTYGCPVADFNDDGKIDLDDMKDMIDQFVSKNYKDFDDDEEYLNYVNSQISCLESKLLWANFTSKEIQEAEDSPYDVNNDYKVNMDDYNPLIIATWNNTNPYDIDNDVNRDGVVNRDDLNTLWEYMNENGLWDSNKVQPVYGPPPTD